MSENKEKLVIAISSRALFDLGESHEVYETEGIDAYSQYQIDNEDKRLEPGVAFTLVEKLLSLNGKPETKQQVEVILLSRNSADTGLRVFNSIEDYKLPIKRAAFTGGQSPYQYAYAFGAQLFLSSEPNDVVKALEAGIAAARIVNKSNKQRQDKELRIAFDGDAVLFSDDSERIYQEKGLEAFTINEKAAAKTPLKQGPFKPFLAALHQLQEKGAPIRTALVTARSAPAHERVIRTLRDWKIRIDEALFLGGLSKGDFLKAFQADIFFDDQLTHVDSASQFVATGHVPHGVTNT